MLLADRENEGRSLSLSLSEGLLHYTHLRQNVLRLELNQRISDRQ